MLSVFLFTVLFFVVVIIVGSIYLLNTLVNSIPYLLEDSIPDTYEREYLKTLLYKIFKFIVLSRRS